MNLGPWPKGVNNKAYDHALGADELRNAVNADFDDLGKPRRRDGATKVYSGLSPKGGFSCPAGMYFVESGSIKKFSAAHSATVISGGITGTEFAWFYDMGVIYFSDGIISLKIVNDVAVKWGMENPAPPTLHGISGTYGSGTYVGAVCWVDADGVESGGSPISSVTLPENSGILFSNLPATNDPQVAYLRLYLSMPNGSELYHIADIAPGTFSYSIASGRYDNSNIYAHLFSSPAPPGRIIRKFKGEMLVADEDGLVWHSDPFEPDHFQLSHNFIQFPVKADLMEPVPDGIYFAYGSQTEFYMGGNGEEFTVLPVFPYGAIYGTSKQLPDSTDVCWQSVRGMCVGRSGGSAKNITEDNVATDTGTSGAALIREKDGLQQFIVSIKGATPSTLAATSWITAEKVRRGE